MYRNSVLSQVRASSQHTMDSRNQMGCGERIRTSAVHSIDKWVNASRPTTVSVRIPAQWQTNYDECKIAES